MLPVPAINAQAISALCLLTITKRFDAVLAALLQDPQAKFTHADYQTVTRTLAIHAPKRGQDPSPEYLAYEEAALHILGTVLIKLEQQADGYRIQAPSAFAMRLAAKGHRILETRANRAESASGIRHSEGRVRERVRVEARSSRQRATAETRAAHEGLEAQLPNSKPSRPVSSPSLPATRSQQYPSSIPVHPSALSNVEGCPSVEKSPSPSPLSGQAKRRLKAQIHEQRMAARRAAKTQLKLQATAA